MEAQPLHITKPKKRENGTYAANIYIQGTKQRYVFDAPGSVIMEIKDISEAEKYFLIKNRKCNAIMCDLNAAVLTQVTENCEAWFRNSLNPSLIDDYFTNTVIYDRQHGDVLRLKVIDMEEEGVPVHRPVNLKFALVAIRFYRQKFVLEWTLEAMEEGGNGVLFQPDADEGDEDAVEVAAPTQEEIRDIQKNYVAELKRRLEEAEAAASQIRELLEEVRCLGPQTFFQVCDRVDKFLEE